MCFERARRFAWQCPQSPDYGIETSVATVARMERINVSQLLHNCGELLRRAGAGESFEVTRHGKPLALLGPLPQDDGPLERLVERGLVQPGARGLAAALEELPPLPAAPPGTLTGSERLAELRRDER